MKLASKPDDPCSGCGHGRIKHSLLKTSCSHRQEVDEDLPTYMTDCHCPEFVPTIVARLVEALTDAVRSGMNEAAREFVSAGDGPRFIPQMSEEGRRACELLVELGVLTKTGEGYEWRKT